MKQFSVYAIALAVSLVSASAHADVNQDNVTTRGSQKVYSSSGSCVRTKWMSANDACAPAPVQAPEPSPVARMVLDQRTIYFDFNKYDLTPESVAKLDALVTAIHQSPDVRRATIVGYADEIGSSANNEKLSQKRADAVNQYLSQRISIPTSVLLVAGKGETNPVTNCSKSLKRKQLISCLAGDRRVEIEFDYVRYMKYMPGVR